MGGADRRRRHSRRGDSRVFCPTVQNSHQFDVPNLQRDDGGNLRRRRAKSDFKMGGTHFPQRLFLPFQSTVRRGNSDSTENVGHGNAFSAPAEQNPCRRGNDCQPCTRRFYALGARLIRARCRNAYYRAERFFPEFCLPENFFPRNGKIARSRSGKMGFRF